jgi:hypothetical protein
MIDFSGGHTGVVGRTREGKTYTVMNLLAMQPKAVLFFNMQHENVPASFIEADGSCGWDAMYKCLESGKKVNFIPDMDLRQAKKQLAGIIRNLFDGEVHDILIVVDEAHLLDEEALNAMMQVTTRGAKWGLYLVPITQRLAKMHNDLMTQLNQTVIFETNFEGNYFKSYNIPIAEIEERLKVMPLFDCPDGKKRHFAYCVWDGKNLTGAFRFDKKGAKMNA